jgi:hypothetical protein
LPLCAELSYNFSCDETIFVFPGIIISRNTQFLTGFLELYDDADGTIIFIYLIKKQKYLLLWLRVSKVKSASQAKIDQQILLDII